MSEANARYRVLLVVRDATERASLGQLLEPDFEVERAGTPDEALGLLNSRPFEVLLIEQQLEGRTGAEVAAEAARLPGAMSCILLAQTAEDLTAAQRSSAQLLTVVVKPWHAARLVRLLEQSARLTLARRAVEALHKQRGG
jgi:DNA-binding NtrC family response regulator